jgi:hypothetical protein
MLATPPTQNADHKTREHDYGYQGRHQNRNAKAATMTQATKKNVTVAKPVAKESKPADKKMNQIEAASAAQNQ